MSDPTAARSAAFTRTVFSPPPSTTSANAASPLAASCNDNTTSLPGSEIGRSAEATATADPPTDAEPDTVNFSPDSTAPSSGTVNINVPDADVPAAGIEIDNLLPVKLVHASSEDTGHEAAREAPPAPATVTATAVADVKTDDEPLKLAVTVISCAAACSSTDDGDNANSISASSSKIVNESPAAAPNTDDPPTKNVSGPSTTESSVIDNPANEPAGATTLRAGNTIVFGDDGAYEKSAAVAFPAPAGVSTPADNVTVVTDPSCDDVAVEKLAATDTPEPDAPSAIVS